MTGQSGWFNLKLRPANRFFCIFAEKFSHSLIIGPCNFAFREYITRLKKE